MNEADKTEQCNGRSAQVVVRAMSFRRDIVVYNRLKLAVKKCVASTLSYRVYCNNINVAVTAGKTVDYFFRYFATFLFRIMYAERLHNELRDRSRVHIRYKTLVKLDPRYTLNP